MGSVKVIAGKTFHRRTIDILIHARKPEITGEYLIGPLSALYHLDLLRYPLGQQIKGHGILTYHGLGHMSHRFRQAWQYLGIRNMELVMAGLVAGNHLIRKFKFATLLLRLILKANGKGQQVLHARLCQQCHQ